MKAALKPLFLLTALSLLIVACSSLPKGAGSGPGSGGPFTISVTVSGLSGTGLVLLDNATDKLTVTANGTFTFASTVATGGLYAVTVQTQPSNPTQTCAATAGGGTATANVTVIVSCTTNPVTATIGGTVSGLVANSSVILQDNGGDSLTITANGAFTFKTAVTGADVYAVTVVTQPVNPNQICTVTQGSGVASANVTSVAVNCVLSYSIGGTVTGLVGTGLILVNSSDSEQLPISAANGNQPFTFKNLVPTGTAYAVTIFAEPTLPTQACVVTTGTGSGTATANVTSVAIVCPAVTYSVGGTVVGLAGVPPNNGPLTDGSFILQNNLGNTLTITENGPFTFATQEALNDQFEITVFHTASTQNQACTRWNYKGVVTASINSIIIDCAHNDWTWIDGTFTAGTIAAPQYGSFPTTAPTTIPNPFTNTPGARYGAAGWTDKAGNLWLFGGDGWELTGNAQPDLLDGAMNDLWVCVPFGDACQWQLQGAYDTTVVNTIPPTTVGAEIIANAQSERQGGSYSTPFVPPARLGAATWTDKTGNLWLFGGSDGAHYLNDLWMFNASALSPNFTAKAAQWTWQSSSVSPAVDQSGIYPPTANPYPGARTNAVSWTDGSGNFWLFGGFGKDGAGTLGFLNDLWEYSGGTWTFVSGSSLANQIGIYGTPGTASTTNAPGGRQEAVGWADAAGNLWLFGGEGEDGNNPPTANGILNDLWEYNIAAKQWTFVMGNTTANQTGVYEAQTVVGPVSTTGAASTCGLTVGLTVSNNVICSPVSTTGALPGSRWGASGWTDAGGNLWLFGGWGLDSTGTNGNGALNDLWVYTPNSTAGQAGTWTWIKGSNTGAANGLYGSLTRPYLTFVNWTPGGRSNATHWVDGNGQLWLFGGAGYDSTSTSGNGYLNDMWRYLPYQN
ncbi:MAG TPA: kelch repeat-containing protein [Candidatus Cybelea sp.]|jgi:hypothetical protein|nr:kelch repeat-containing protein [Candidatus Cybelea sp.]